MNDAKAKTAMRIEDEELQALAKINKIISELPDEAVGRVLNWLNGRYADAKPILKEEFGK